MMWVFFDASALVKRYSAESGAALLNELFLRHPVERMTCTTLGILEIVSVFVRKRNDGRLSQRLFAQAMLEFSNEVIENEAFPITAIQDDVILASLDLIPRHNINATDAVILRSCLNFQQALLRRSDHVVLWSCDKRLLRAATQEGIVVFDPEVMTGEELQALLA